MRNLILIKHAAVDVDANLPPEKWRLSEKGKESCRRLAELLERRLPFFLACSEETKAMETAGEIAKDLQISYAPTPGLEEHNRSNVPVMRSAEFISMMELFFRKHDELVLGAESAATALARFRSAVDEILTEHPEEDVAIVTHGTVIALFIEHFNDTAGFGVWRKMGLPSVAILGIPDFAIIEMIERI